MIFAFLRQEFILIKSYILCWIIPKWHKLCTVDPHKSDPPWDQRVFRLLKCSDLWNTSAWYFLNCTINDTSILLHVYKKEYTVLYTVQTIYHKYRALSNSSSFARHMIFLLLLSTAKLSILDAKFFNLSHSF